MFMIGKSTKALEIMRTAEWVATTDVLIYLTGKAGTGKQSLAQQLHKLSSRSRKTIYEIDCSSFTQAELCERLFGHSLNVFTDNRSNLIGLLAQAQGSTLYIKSINTLSMELQSKLLQFIETGELIHGDHSKPRQIDVRLIVSSEESLTQVVKNGTFRTDLYYRLNTILLHLPKLESRIEDVEPLMHVFFQRLVKKHRIPAPSLTQQAIKKLTQYSWPGNLDELSSFCESILFSKPGQQVDIAQLPAYIRDIEASEKSDFVLPEKGIKLDSVESDFIIQALNKTYGNKSKAARLLGLSRDTLLYRIKKHAIAL